MKYFAVIILLIALVVTVPAQTQTVPPTPPTIVTTTINVPPITTTVTMPIPNVKVAPFPGDKVFTEMSLPGARKVVKNAPFSAEGISESVHTLEDGNRIRRSVTTKMYRDSEGRFRRETTASTGGSGYFYSTGGGGLTMFGSGDSISIFDPVAGMSYSLNPTEKTGRSFSVQTLPGKGVYTVGTTKMIDPQVKAQVEAKIAEAKKEKEKTGNEKTVKDKKSSVVIAPGMVYGSGVGGIGVGMGVGGGIFVDDKNSKTEQLGTKMMEGVEVEGTKTVTTIEAGKIGNERDIEITYERWYSKDLDMIVYSRHYDPRSGEQTYKLVNIDRSEPDRSLFTVPADYKIEQSKGFTLLSPTAPTTTTKQQ